MVVLDPQRWLELRRFRALFESGAVSLTEVAKETGLLLVDHDFCLQGYTRTWRLSADRTDREARQWAVALLEDCAKYILANHGHTAMDRLRGGPPSPPLDDQLYDVLPARLRELARDLTTAGLLRHRTRHLGMSSAQLAEEAILPEPLVTAWPHPAGRSPAFPLGASRSVPPCSTWS